MRFHAGVQVIAPPWLEDIALRIAYALEQVAVFVAPRPSIQGKRMDIDLPEVVAEVKAAFDRYEEALTTNDLAVLNAIFRDAPQTVRYGIAENLYGHDEIQAFRGARLPVGLMRSISRTVITTYGRDFAVASTLFRRETMPGKVGRQMQSWVRFPNGWHVVAAHVSLIDDKPA